MMNKKYTAVILAFLVMAAEANTIANKPVPRALNAETKWDGLGLTADVNHYVDETIHMIVPVMKQNGLDPMELPDIEEGFSVRPLLITYSAWLRIHNGKMTGLLNIDRSGDQVVNYFAKMLRVRVQLQVTDLKFDYKYLVKVMNIGPTGGIVATLDRFLIVVDLLIDFNNDEVHLQEFSLTDIGLLRVLLTGHILVDWLLNSVINVFVRIFDTIIMKVVQNNIRNSVQSALDFINSNIKDIVKAIESYN